jgi:starch phosphorylase
MAAKTSASIKTTVLKSSKEAFENSFNFHLQHSLARDLSSSTANDRLLAISYAVRDRLIDRWMETQRTYYAKDVKRVYYLSLEYLIGRTLGNSILNLNVEEEVEAALNEMGIHLEELRELEVDAGLGNGGLGRLAACFIDSMATLEIAACGMGIRYEFGMFNQIIEDGAQHERPDNWLRRQNPWEIARPENCITVPFYGKVHSWTDEKGRQKHSWETSHAVIAFPYDTPVPGYNNNTVNNLRLWSAKSADEFGLKYFNDGDYLSAVEQMELSEVISKVLYPNDSSMNGKELRLKQQYFLCSASLQDIIRRWKKTHKNFDGIENKIVIQLNDTHPAISIPELMRLLMDIENLDWKRAWQITSQVFAYTNHTLLPEALEAWPVFLIENLLPRHMQIIYEINAQFLRQVSLRWPGDNERLARMSIIEEGSEKMVRMAFLSIIGSFSVNGVAALHTDLLKAQLFKDFFEFSPAKFNNKTNGVTQRRWLKKCNPNLASLISSKQGDAWVTNLDDLRKLEKFADDKTFQKDFQKVKYQNKVKLAEFLKKTQDVDIDPSSMFDVQVKRMHEYKRQLLNVLHVIHLYNQIKAGKKITPRTVMLGGKAAPGYWMAKQIILFYNHVASVVNSDPAAQGLLKVVFLENYRVSFAEKIIPAADLSEQISTAGKEASGTGNMKFALNGALTIGTLDGANVEMLEEIGEENIFIFGLKVDEAQALSASDYQPFDFYENDPDLKKVLDLVGSGFFSPENPALFTPILTYLLEKDPYLLMADFRAYIETQEKISDLYLNQKEWVKKAILNVARVGKFSSDRTIGEYNRDIWKAEPVKITLTH